MSAAMAEAKTIGGEARPDDAARRSVAVDLGEDVAEDERDREEQHARRQRSRVPSSGRSSWAPLAGPIRLEQRKTTTKAQRAPRRSSGTAGLVIRRLRRMH
jgi:hypothetical protein